MAMRLRRVNGTLIAVCAALTEAEEGDVYLNDEQHYALSMKYAYEAGQLVGEYAALMDQEQGYRDAEVEMREWVTEEAS